MRGAVLVVPGPVLYAWFTWFTVSGIPVLCTGVLLTQLISNSTSVWEADAVKYYALQYLLYFVEQQGL
jgi:hypothetical protein